MENWKDIPLLKPGKVIDEGKSYRPISLLSPSAKVLEKIILPDIAAKVPLKTHQHGFRKLHSTTTSALQEVNFHIRRGLNMKAPCNRTVLVAIDLSRAFDTVCHEKLLFDILNLDISPILKKFLASYLRGRQQYVEFRGSKSKYRIVRQGVPQGGVLSPLLFNLYMSSMPDPPGNIVIVSYADDCQVMSFGPKFQNICEEINPYLDQLTKWFKERHLEISPEKSTATLFTTYNGEVNEELPIFIEGKQVPTVKNPKILGVTYDNLMKFGKHTKIMKEKVQKKNNVLKCLAGTTWGKSKEILTTTYKSIGRSILNYAAPAWSVALSDTNWKHLETAQNSALRTITGCVKMTERSHLNTETKILPVEEHSKMLSDQFLMSMHEEQHSNYHQLSKERPPRKIRTMITDQLPNISEHTENSPFSNKVIKSKKKKIHTDTVKRVTDNYPPNKVLLSRAPPIHEDETKLPRTTRSTLAQLRSGYSSHLNSYLHRIERSETDKCPNCKTEIHTSQHIFNCTSKPTTLNVRDLWNKPRKVAEYMSLPLDDNDDTNQS